LKKFETFPKFERYMELIPIRESLEENKELADDPLYKENIHIVIDFYKKVGYNPPWICYYVQEDGLLIGSAAFKGKPLNGTVEIAYGTMEEHRQKGVGTRICRQLVELSLKTDPSVRITARTLPDNSYSTRILEKNNFVFVGEVNDPDDGEVWEWEYHRTPEKF